MDRLRWCALFALCGCTVFLVGCEQVTAPVSVLPAYRAVSVDGVALPVIVAQSSTTDYRLVGELLELDAHTGRAWRTTFVARRDRESGAEYPDTLPRVQGYEMQQVGARVVLRPATPCLAIFDCSSPDTLYLDGATARLRAAAWGRRELGYAPAVNPYGSGAP